MFTNSVVFSFLFPVIFLFFFIYVSNVESVNLLSKAISLLATANILFESDTSIELIPVIQTGAHIVAAFTGVILRMKDVILWLTDVILYLRAVILQVSLVILRLTVVILQSSDVILQLSDVILHLKDGILYPPDIIL